jgi:flagellar biosynthesis/type III secretory pathway protein FliH
MARVIKGQKSDTPEPKVIVAAPKVVGGGRVIERDVYRAQQEAREIVKQGELDKKKRLAEGKRQANQAREEAMAKGAADAFAEAAKEAIVIFKNRANRYADVESDIHVLADEITLKVLGSAPSLKTTDVDAIVKAGVNRLRARRRLKLQFSPGRLAQLKVEQADVLSRVAAEPDFDLEDASDVNPGFVRVVTDVGGALCDESAAVSTLSQVFLKV